MIGDVDMDTAMFIDTDSDGRGQKNGDSVKTENLVEPGVGGEAVHNPAQACRLIYPIPFRKLVFLAFPTFTLYSSGESFLKVRQ